MDCPDCGVVPGNWHRPGCVWEQCPYCGDHLVDCICTKGPPPLDDRMAWTGCCTWLDACLEFGLFEKEVSGQWVPCHADDLDSQPDLRRLVQEFYWNRDEKRFERRREQHKRR